MEKNYHEKYLEIEGGFELQGSVSIAGAKNAVLPILAAALLTPHTLRLENVPQLRDTDAMVSALRELGAHIDEKTLDACLEIRMGEQPRELPPGAESAARNIRTGVLCLGPMLARFGWAQACLPGGCPIGTRPLDLHIWGLEKLGASIAYKGARIEAKGTLRPANIDLPFPSVGASENLIMAALGAKGSSRLRGVAREPEVVDLCRCLRAMGANIGGEGSAEIVVEGKKNICLHSAKHRLLPDRIEAGSYALAVAATGGSLLLRNAPPYEDLQLFLDQLKLCGIECSEERCELAQKPEKNQHSSSQNNLRITRSGELRAVSISTAPHPGFPTDLQAQFTAAMCFARNNGKQITIAENVFENRFMHIPELKRMGAEITLHGQAAQLTPRAKLHAAPVIASDLRASFSLIIAALAARGTTTITELQHLDRGYEKIEAKLAACGARIKRCKKNIASISHKNHSQADAAEVAQKKIVSLAS